MKNSLIVETVISIGLSFGFVFWATVCKAFALCYQTVVCWQTWRAQTWGVIIFSRVCVPVCLWPAQTCANLPVFSLIRGRFWGFSPRSGDTLHRLGVKFGKEEGTEGSLLLAKLHPHQCNDKGVGPQKLKFLLRFDRNLEYKRSAGAYPFRDFHKMRNVCTSFQVALGVKIWLDLLEGLWSYGGFKLRRSGFPQIFSAP